MKRTWYFGAGPAALPHSVLEQAQHDLINWKDTGLSILEINHRTEIFHQFSESIKQKLRAFLNIPQEYQVLLMHGGATAQFSIIPMNFLAHDKFATYLDTGYWSQRASMEAKKFGNVCVVPVVCKSTANSASTVDDLMKEVDMNSCYVHFTYNETIAGIEYPFLPIKKEVPLICDMTSNLLTRKVDISKFSLIYASAQKNLGIAGLCLVIAHENLLKTRNDRLPLLYDYNLACAQKSIVNTPAVFTWYMLDQMLNWIKNNGGVDTMEQLAQQKSELLYKFIDSGNFYHNEVYPFWRSRINVPFFLKSSDLEEMFIKLAEEAGLMGLRGHRSSGGVRASLYNAMPIEGVCDLIKFMREFANAHA